ncbi:MAG: hypothetical protein LQ346_006044 [Caloplaca aetnensis]|nr:MAG: hypothetical protein LQ346_006044 [Caloplaca aetnensis]
MLQESPELAQLAARIQNLPQELRDEIEDWVYELDLSGGFVHLQGGTKYHDGCEKLPAPNAQILTVDKHVAAKYADRIWTENTLVIDIGKSMMSSRQDVNVLAASMCPDLVRKVLIRFSSRQMHFEAGIPWRPRPTTGPSRTTDDPCLDYFHVLQERVFIARDILAQLPSLERVTLDFTECFGLEGKFYGHYAAVSIRGFRHKDCKKPDIEVLTPLSEQRSFDLRHYIGNGFRSS